MKRTIAFCWTLAWLAGGAFDLSAAPAIAIDATSGYRDTTVGIPVKISGASGVVALQFDIQFDPSILLAGTASGGAALAGHAVVSNSPTNNLLRVIIYSPTNAPVSDGALAVVPFTISSSAPFGVYSLSVTNILLANSVGGPLTPGPSGIGTLAVNAGIPPHLDALALALNGEFTFVLSGAEGQSYVLQSSQDLKSWTPFTTNSVLGGTATIHDVVGPTVPKRFYRAIEGF